MMLEKMLNMGGVQMMLGNLLKAAAPQLAEQVSEIGKVIIAFKEQTDRIERQNLLIMKHLGIGENENDNRGTTGSLTEASNGAGKQAG